MLMELADEVLCFMLKVEINELSKECSQREIREKEFTKLQKDFNLLARLHSNLKKQNNEAILKVCMLLLKLNM